MLEKYIATLLVPYFSKYVENIDESKLNIDLWNGRVSLQDLVLRAAVLDAFLDPNATQEVEGSAASASPPLPSAGSSRPPFRVHCGVCSNANLTIPFKHLRSQPIVLEIDEVLLTLRVPGGGEGGAEDGQSEDVNVKSRYWDGVAAAKARELERFEEERRRQRGAHAVDSSGPEGTVGGSKAEETSEKKGGFISQLGELVINNMIIKARSVHVRYEDASHRVVCGAVLGNVQLLTVDERTGEASFVDPAGLQRMSKRFVFSDLQVYCDDPVHMKVNEELNQCWYSQESDPTSWRRLMMQRIREGDVDLSTILGPVSGQVDAQLVFGKSMRQLLDAPYAQVVVQLQHVMARLTRCQYTTIVRTVSRFTNWREMGDVIWNRPREPVKGHARLWWRFAIRTVRRVLAEPRQRRILERVSEICCIDYQVLYRDVVRKTEMSPEKKRSYRFITRFMTTSDMIDGRRYVYAQLAKEIELRRKDHEVLRAEALAIQAHQQTQQSTQRSGWLRWLRPSDTSASASAVNVVDEEESFFQSLETEYGLHVPDITQELRSAPSHHDLPASYNWLDLSLSVPFMCFRVIMTPEETASLSVYQLHSRILTFQKEKSIHFNVLMHNITLSHPFRDSDGGRLVENLIDGIMGGNDNDSECSTPSSVTTNVFTVASGGGGADQRVMIPPPTLLGIVSEGSVLGSFECSTASNDDSGSAARLYVCTRPLLQLSGCVHPVGALREDTVLDAAFRIRLLPLRIIACPATILSMARFFRVPAGADLSAISATTRHAAAAVGTAASQELRRAMASARGIFLSVDVSAPIVLLPKTLSGSADESTLAVSLGRIRFRSQPLTETEKARRLAHSDETSEDMLYYNSTASFSKFFISLTTLSDALHRPTRGFMIVPTVAITADVLQLIDRSNHERDPFILKLRVPRMHAACSLHQMYLLTSMIEVWATTWATHSTMDGTDSDAPLPQRLLGSSLVMRRDAPLHTEGHCPCAGGGVLPPPTTKEESSGGTGSPTSACATPGGTAAAAFEDAPVMRVELLVEQLSFDVHEDDMETLQPITPARFTVSCAVEYLMSVRPPRTTMVLIFTTPCLMDMRDVATPIVVGASQFRVDVCAPRDLPLSVGLSSQEGAIAARLGTPLLEFLENVMDLVNLIVFALSEAPPHPREVVTPLVGSLAWFINSCDELSPNAIPRLSRASDEAYYATSLPEQATVSDTRVANVSIQLRGSSTVEFFNRRLGDTEDYLFASAAVKDVDVQIKKNTVTMEVNGSVGEVSARVAECHGLLPEHSVVLQHTPHAHRSQSTTKTLLPLGAPDSEMESASVPQQGTGGGPVADAHEAAAASGPAGAVPPSTTPVPSVAPLSSPRAAASPHVSFSFRKGRPVTPIFTECSGKRVLSNAADLRYSNAFELVLGESTVVVDMYTVMLLQTYLTTGFLSRLMEVADRPLYNGQTLPPAREGPRLLTSMRVVARDVVVALPLDARTGTEVLYAAVGHLVVQTSLHASEGVQTTSISLREIALWHTMGGPAVYLVPPKTSMEVALRSAIDLTSDDALHVDMRSDDIAVNIRAEDLVSGCRLLRQNLSRTEVDAGMSVASRPTLRRAPSARGLTLDFPAGPCASGTPSIGQMNRDTILSVRLARVAVRLGEVSDVPSLSLGPFDFCSSGIALHLSMPINALHFTWRTLELYDMRGGEPSLLFQCEEGAAKSATSLTTRTIVMSDFGVRPSALSSARPAADVGGSIGAESDLTGEMPPVMRRHSTSDLAALQTLELISLSVFTIDFTLRRFAVSDQWLRVYDFFSNESVVAQWQAPQVTAHSLPMTADAAEPHPDVEGLSSATDCGARPPDSQNPALSSATGKAGAVTAGGFRFVVSTPSVVVPFLTSDSVTLVEATITSLLLDVVGLPGGNEVTVRLKEVDVVDCKSREKVVTTRRARDGEDSFERGALDEEGGSPSMHFPAPFDALPASPFAVSVPTTVAGNTAACVGASASAVVWGAGEDTANHASLDDGKDVLGFTFTSNPSARKNRMVFALGQLDLLCSLPLLYSLLDYLTAPDQPVARIANLGVMSEQREHMAQAAQDMANSATLSLHLLWRQPRILLVGDADDLSNRSRNMEVRLGTLRAILMLDRVGQNMSFQVKIHDVSVPELLAKTTVRFGYQAKGGSEELALTLDRVSALLFPSEVERIFAVMYCNVLRPRVRSGYYGEFTSAVQSPPVRPADVRPVTGADGDAEGVATRAVTMTLGSLQLEIHDAVGLHTHTLAIADLHLVATNMDTVSLRIPTIRAVENFTNRTILHSGPKARTPTGLGSRKMPPVAPTAAMTPEEAAPDAVFLLADLVNGTTHVELAQVTVIVVPRGVGALLNTMLSIQIPSDIMQPPWGSPTAGPTAALTPAPTARATNQSVASTPSSSTCLPAAVERGADASEAEVRRSVTAHLQECTVVIASGGDTDVAVARLAEVRCSSATMSDGSSTLSVQMGRLTVEDKYSAVTSSPEIVCAYDDAAQLPASGSPPSDEKHFVNFSLWSAPPAHARRSLDSPASTSEEGPPPSMPYAKCVTCEVCSLSFIVVPDVTRALLQAIAEVRQHVSEVNQDRAVGYISEKAAQSTRPAFFHSHNASEEFPPSTATPETAAGPQEGPTQIRFTVQRPRIVFVEKATSSKCIELFPGTLTAFSEVVTTTASTEAVTNSGDATAPPTELCPREVLRVRIDRMGMHILGQDVFTKDCVVDVQLQRTLAVGSASTKPRETVLSVTVPQLRMRLSPRQLHFAMEVAGVFMHGSATLAAVHSESFVSSGPSRNLGPTTEARRPESALRRPALSALPQPASAAGAVVPPVPAEDVDRHAVFAMHVSVGLLQTDLAELFRFRIDDVKLESFSTAHTGSTKTLSMASMVLRHVGAYVEEGSGGKLKRVDEIVDWLTLDRLTIESKQPAGVMDVEYQAYSEEVSLDIDVGFLKLSISPTILFDTRDVLYLPFSAKVLRVPLEPIPVLPLYDAVTFLDGDVFLDDKHVVLTTNRMRCSYHLDLNNHRLVLTGRPSAQIVLYDGCQLTISNGTVVIPGQYAIGSFVSFAPATALFTTADCAIEKQYLTLGNLTGLGKPPGSPKSVTGGGGGSTNRASLPAVTAAARATTADAATAPSIPLERSKRTVLHFACGGVVLEMLSEGCHDLSTSLCMQMQLNFKQDTENDEAVRRSISAQLVGVQSSLGEERTLLPTTVTGNLSGVENVSLSIIVGAVEFSSRVALIRTLVEIMKDFGTAFVEETTMKRYAPRVQFEDKGFEKLRPLSDAGECVNCGSNRAYLGTEDATRGTLCLRCCAGRDSFPATEFRLEIPSVNGILVGANDGMMHLYLRRVLVSLDANMDMSICMIGAVYNFSHSAAVWEPFVEQMEVAMSGSVSTHDYKVRLPRLDLVISPQSAHIVSAMVAEYGATFLQHAWLRKRFRQYTQVLAKESGNFSNLAMGFQYVDHVEEVDSVIDVVPRDLDEGMVTMSSCTNQSILGTSLLDGLPSESAGGSPPASAAGPKQNDVYATVNLINHTSSTMLLSGRPIPPGRGDATGFASVERSATVGWEQPFMPSDEGYVVSLDNPPHYCQARDFLLESSVSISLDQATRRLRRVVDLHIYPLCTAQSVVCLANNLGYTVHPGRGFLPLKPQERLYLPPNADLRASLFVQPMTSDAGVTYTPASDATSTSGARPAILSLLGGGTMTLTSTASATDPQALASVSSSRRTLWMRVTVHQESMRAGVPTFVMSLEPLYTLENRLPYTVVVHCLAATGSSKSRERLFSCTVDPLARAELPLDPRGPTQAKLILQVQQSTADHFASLPIGLASGLVTLRSSDRKMVVRATYANNALRVTTPFCLLNHTPIPLTVRECDANGDIRGVHFERNYSVLHPNMNACIAAAPKDAGKDTFFINLYSGSFSAKRIPLHVQQQGVILLEDAMAAKDAKAAGAAKSRGGHTSNPNTTPQSREVMHLAYSSRLDESGAILITLTPRWVVANKSRLPLYIAPSEYGGVSGQEASAAAAAVLESEAAEEQNAKTASSPSETQKDIDAFKNVLQSLGHSDALRLRDPSQALVVAPETAVPLLRTPFCPPEVGYHVHVLLSPLSPLYGTPVNIETIHSELVIVYAEDEAVGTTTTAPASTKEKKKRDSPRDRFYEVSLVTHSSYMYITLEQPSTVPFILLNRSRYDLEVRDTSRKTTGRLMAAVPSGHGAELMLDPSVTTLAQFVPRLAGSAGPPEAALFDLGRAMTAKERREAPCGLIYEITYGQEGQNLVEVLDACPSRAIVQTALASPATPLHVLGNVVVTTVSVVLPCRDVLFAVVSDTRLSWNRNERRESWRFSVKSYQVDNQTEVAPRYVSCLLALRKSEEDAAISGFVKRHLVAVKSLLWFEEVRLDVTPFALRVSDTLLVTLVLFFHALQGVDHDNMHVRPQARLGAAVAQSAQCCPSPSQLWRSTPAHGDYMSTRVILERFIINPIVVRFWLSRDSDDSDFIKSQMPTKDAAFLSMMVTSCEDLQIAAPGIVSMRRLSRLSVLLEWVLTSYKDGLLAELQGVVLQYAASLPLIGVPVKLASGFGSGAVRLFRDPIEGLATSPKAFALGLANGSAGFAAGLTGGGLDAFANLTDAGSRLLSFASGMSERERRNQTLLSGFSSGFRGVVQRPMAGAAQHGTAGFVLGTAQGLLGVLVNPMAGLLSDVSRATGTAAKLVTDTYIPHTQRLRSIRHFFANGGVAPWGSLLSVYQYQRYSSSSKSWSGANLIASVDGPEWYPRRRTETTVGPSSEPLPPGGWMLDRYDADFEGWSYSSRYYGVYTAALTRRVRTRRQRWVVMIRPLAHSGIAAYLGVCPGMERARDGAPLPPGSIPPHTLPGILKAVTLSAVRQLEAEQRERRLQLATAAHSVREDSFMPWEDEHLSGPLQKKQGISRCCSSARIHTGVKADVFRERSSSPSANAAVSVNTELEAGADAAVPVLAPAGVPSRSSSGSSRAKASAPAAKRPLFATEGPASSCASPLINTPTTVTIEIYEYERRLKLLGWSKRYLGADCSQWQDAQGHAVPSKNSTVLPPGWVWTGDWTISGGGAEGWSVMPEDSNLRRRLWCRRRSIV